jgi:acyl-CoA hydrolase
MPDLQPVPSSASATEMVQVVLPNDANPLGYILGGTVMHLIDIAGAIACHRHTRSLVVTAAVDGLQFLHSISVGDLIILKARVTAAFTTWRSRCSPRKSSPARAGSRAGPT